MPEVIPIGADHAGFELKQRLVEELRAPDFAHQVASRVEHHDARRDANVLILPARFLSEAEGVEILKTWLGTEFAGGRHGGRVAKIDQEQG